MNLERKLNSVGKSVFVRHYDIFELYDSGQIGREEAINFLMDSKISNYNGASIRVGNAKAIFDNGKVKEALNLVLQAERVSLEVKDKASKIIEKIV